MPYIYTEYSEQVVATRQEVNKYEQRLNRSSRTRTKRADTTDTISPSNTKRNNFSSFTKKTLPSQMAAPELVTRACLDVDDEIGDPLTTLTNVVVILDLTQAQPTSSCYSWHDLRATIDQPWLPLEERVRFWRSAPVKSNFVYRLRDRWYDPSTDPLTSYYNTFAIRSWYEAGIGTSYGVSNLHGAVERIYLLEPLSREVATQALREGWSSARLATEVRSTFTPQITDMIAPQYHRLRDTTLFFGRLDQELPYGYGLLWQRGQQDETRIFDGSYNVSAPAPVSEELSSLRAANTVRSLTVGGRRYILRGTGASLICTDLASDTVVPCPPNAEHLATVQASAVAVYLHGEEDNPFLLTYDPDTDLITCMRGGIELDYYPDLLYSEYIVRIQGVEYPVTIQPDLLLDPVLEGLAAAAAWTRLARAQVVIRREAAVALRGQEPNFIVVMEDIAVYTFRGSLVYLHAGAATTSVDLLAPFYSIQVGEDTFDVLVSPTYQLTVYDSDLLCACTEAIRRQIAEAPASRPNSFELEIGRIKYSITSIADGWLCINVNTRNESRPLIDNERPDIFVDFEGSRYTFTLDPFNAVVLRDAEGNLRQDDNIVLRYYDDHVQHQYSSTQTYRIDVGWGTGEDAVTVVFHDNGVVTVYFQQIEIQLPDLLYAAYSIVDSDSDVEYEVRIGRDLRINNEPPLPPAILELLNDQVRARQQLAARVPPDAVADFTLIEDGISAYYVGAQVTYLWRGAATTTPNLLLPLQQLTIGSSSVVWQLTVDALFRYRLYSLPDYEEASDALDVALDVALTERLNIAPAIRPNAFIIRNSYVSYHVIRQGLFGWLVLEQGRVVSENLMLDGRYSIEGADFETRQYSFRDNFVVIGDTPAIVSDYLESLV